MLQQITGAARRMWKQAVAQRRRSSLADVQDSSGELIEGKVTSRRFWIRQRISGDDCLAPVSLMILTPLAVCPAVLH